MLTISRKAGQQLRFVWGGKDVLIDVVAVAGHRVRLEVSAPPGVDVEVLEAKSRAAFDRVANRGTIEPLSTPTASSKSLDEDAEESSL